MAKLVIVAPFSAGCIKPVGKRFSREELSIYVGKNIRRIKLASAKSLYFDMDAEGAGRPCNTYASMLAGKNIFGDVIVE